MNTETLFKSATYEWETPQLLFDSLNTEFHFQVDVCALPHNAKCERFFSPVNDGLQQNWRNLVCWMNPPYDREITIWMLKAYYSSLAGATVVCLVPSRTDTIWWHEFALKGEVRFVKGRLKFGSASDPAPFPSAIVVFRPYGQYVQSNNFSTYNAPKGQ